VVTLLLVLAVLAVVFGVAVVLTGRTDVMSEEHQDLADTGIPRDRPMNAQDVAGLRFALAFRGYRMDEVDEALDRLAAEIEARDDAIAQLVAERSTRARAAEDPAAVWGRPGDEEGSDDDSLDDAYAGEYVPSDATGDLPADVETDVLPVPDPGPQGDGIEPEFVEPEPAQEPDVPILAEAPEPEPEPEPAPATQAEDSPIFGSLTPPPDGPNPFRPEVPEIPTYDPWAVTPKSRYTEGPTYVEVDDETDDDETVDAIAEHHTGYAPPPPAEDDPEERPKPPWQR